jgi:putative intracellular protease/amidase
MNGLRSWAVHVSRFQKCDIILPETDGTNDCILLDTRGKGVWDDYHVVDGRLVTGMNPQSARSTAKAALEVFEKL